MGKNFSLREDFEQYKNKKKKTMVFPISMRAIS